MARMEVACFCGFARLYRLRVMTSALTIGAPVLRQGGTVNRRWASWLRATTLKVTSVSTIAPLSDPRPLANANTTIVSKQKCARLMGMSTRKKYKSRGPMPGHSATSSWLSIQGGLQRN